MILSKVALTLALGGSLVTSSCVAQCQNLGPLTCMAVGHNNSGIAPGFLLHSVLVYVVTTGQTYWCVCVCGLSLKVALESKEFNVTVERSRSTDLLWCLL